MLFQDDIPALVQYLTDFGAEKFFVLNYAHKANMSLSLNQWTSETCRQIPGAVPFGTIHPDDDNLVEVVKRSLTDFGLYGIKLQLNVQRFRADDERIFPVYEKVIELGKCMIIHTTTAPIHDEFVGVKYMRNVMKRYPKLKVVIPHMGLRESQEFFDLMAEYPGIWLDNSAVYSYSMGLEPDFSVDRLVQFQDRILYGSDFPQVWFDPKLAVDRFLESELSEGIRHKIFYENGISFLASLGYGSGRRDGNVIAQPLPLA